MAESDEFSAIPTTLWRSLRKCQQESLVIGLKYAQSVRAEASNRSCLISLPTGAGKSGVITGLAHFSTQARVLVLCHRRAVCNQLTKDIEGAFFRKICPDEAVTQKSVFGNIDDISQGGIYVATFQKLGMLDANALAAVQATFELIIIDEGHSEPSPIWRTLVRGSRAHKIVVTATPYRNDLFQFNIDADASYVYTFGQALEDSILREPTFESIHADEIVTRVEAYLNAHSDAKCIIKCKTFDDVERFYSLFNSVANVIAIHERYVGADARINAKASVPSDIATSNFNVLIHQKKLDEGIDIPAAKLLVLTYILGSGRELVQTIGRVVRLAGDLQPLVLELGGSANSAMWMNYRRFDRSLRSPVAVMKFLASLNTARLIELYLEAFPEFSYHDNRFVGKFDLATFDLDSSLTIPTASVCFLYTEDAFALEQMVDTLHWRSADVGELVRICRSESTDITVLVAIAFRRSRFISDALFFEPTLEITLVKRLADHVLAIFDSRGRTFSWDEELQTKGPLEQDRLLRVMTMGSSVRPKEASTRSISSARRRPEAIMMRGSNLDEIGGQQANAAYRMATVKCDTLNANGIKTGSYYVGVDSGRISDQMQSKFNLADLNDWFTTIEQRLASDEQPTSRMLDSFAKPVSANADLLLESLVFDFSSYDSPINFTLNGQQIVLDNDFLYRVCSGGSFLLAEGINESMVTVVVQNEHPYLTFTWGAEIGNEDFLSKSLHKAFFKDGISFSAGKLYELKLPTQDGFSVRNSNLSEVLTGLPALLNSRLTEKGHVDGIVQTANDEFSSESVFYLVDQLKGCSGENPSVKDLGPFYRYLPDVDLVLCSDMGTEPADFILSSPTRLVYVHVKCGSSSVRPESSAGALAEVGSQAIKNLEMLVSADRNLKAVNWVTLLSPWPDKNAAQILTNRIRLLGGQRFDANASSHKDALQQLWGIISDRRRSVGVRKEAWIVAVNSFSVSHFEDQMSMGRQGSGESIQAYQLMQAWLNTANSLDTELRIFASL